MNEELESIVAEMIRAGESEENIALVIKNYTNTEPVLETQPVQPASHQPSKVWEFVKSVPGLFSRGATEFVPSVMEVLGAGESLIGSGLRKLGVNESEESLFAKGAGATREFIEEGTYVSPEAEQSIGGQVVKGVGQIVPFMLSGGASGAGQLAQAPKVLSAAQLIPETAKVIGKQAVSPSGIIGGSMIAGPEWTAAKEAGLSDEEAFNTMIKNYFVGQTEIIPIQNAMKVFNALSGGKVMNALKSAGTGGVQEAIQEGFQTYLTNMIAQEDYDPDRDPMFQVVESMKVGGLVGMFIPAVGSVVQSAKGTVKDKLQNKLNELQADAEIAENDTGNPEINDDIDKQTKEVEEVITPVQKEDVFTETEQAEKSEQTQEQTGDTEEQVGSLQLSISDIIEQGLEVETDRGVKGKMVLDKGGKITVRDRGVIQEFGNLSEIGGKQMEELRLKLTQPKAQKPFNGETLTMTVNDFLKEKVKARVKGKTEGVRRGAELKNELVKRVQETLKQANLSPRQVSTLLTKVRGTNLFSPGSISKLKAFTDKVVADAQYAEKVSTALKRKKTIDKTKKNRKKLTVQEQQAAQEFSFVDPTEVTNIDEYLDKANKLVKSYLPATKATKGTIVEKVSEAAPLEEIRDYARNVITETYKRELGSPDYAPSSVKEMVDAIRDQRQRVRDSERISRLAEIKGINIEEVRALYGTEVEFLPDEAKTQVVKEELIRIAVESKDSLPNEAVPITYDSDITQDQADKYFQSLKEVDVNDLSVDELKVYIKAVDKVVANGDYGGLGNFSALVEAQKGMKEIVADKNISDNLFRVGDMTRSFASLPQLIQSIFGGITKAASKFQLNAGFTGVSDAGAKSMAERRRLEKIFENLRTKYPKTFEGDSRFRRGVYARLMEYPQGATQQQINETFELNKDFIERDILSHKKAKDLKSAETLEKLYKPFRDAKSPEDATRIMKKLDPQSLEVHNALVEFYKPMGEKVKAYSYSFFNRSEPVLENYVGKRSWVSIGSKNSFQSTEVDPEEIRQPNIMSVAKPKQTASSFGRNASIAYDDNGRPKPINQVMNYDVDSIALDHIQQTTFEIEAIPHMIQVRHISKRPELLKVFGEDTNPDYAGKIYRSIFDPKIGTYFSFEKSSLGISDTKKDDLERTFSRGLKVARELGYAATLSGPTQIFKQSTVLFNTGMKLGADVSVLGTLPDLLQPDTVEFLKDKTVGQRATTQAYLGFGENVKLDNLIDKAAHFSSESFVSKKFKWFVGKNMAFLTRTDAAVAQASYLAFYKQYLKQNGGKFNSWAEERLKSDEKIRKEANAYAKQQVDVLQTASNPNEQAAKIKTTNIWGQLLKNAVIPYGTFALNQKIRLANDAKQALIGNRKQRIAGAKDFAATFTEMVMFQAVAWGTRVGLGFILKELAQMMFGELPEEDEEERANRINSDIQRFVTQVAVDMIPLVVTSPESIRDMIPALMNKATLEYHNMSTGEELTEREFEEEFGMPFSSYKATNKGLAEAAAENLGVYGRGYALINDIAENIGDVVTEGDPEKEAEPMTKPELHFVWFTAWLQSMSMTGGVPSDIRFAVERENKRQRRRRADKTQPYKNRFYYQREE